MLISVEQTILFCCGLLAGHPLGNYFLQIDVQLWCPHFLTERTLPPLLRHLKDINTGFFTDFLSDVKVKRFEKKPIIFLTGSTNKIFPFFYEY